VPTYLRPGVYIEEYLNPLINVDTDPAEAAAAFIGVATQGGPVGPTLVNSWSAYQALFGNIANGTDDLGYALYTYFQNGGRAAYVVRALNTNATAATLTLNDGAGTPVSVLTATASAPGVWASAATSPSRVYLTVKSGATGTNRFDLNVEVGTGNYLAASETFVDLSMNPSDPRYVLDVVNSPVIGSKFISLALAGAYVYNATTPVVPATATKVPLTGGSDGTGTPDLVAATQRLEAVDRNLVINVPNASNADLTSIVTWAEGTGRHFVVADAPKPAPGDTGATVAAALTTFAAALPKSSHVAVYGPWIYISDPGSRAGALRLTAPGGAVVGVFMRTDVSRGVFKAPAGVQTTVAGAVSPFLIFTNTQLDSLSGSNVNVLRTIPGSGVVVWGARTQATIAPDKYVPVRRLLISLKSSLHALTRFAVFENNNEDLRATVEETVRSFLQSQFDIGAFKGDTTDDAFYVVCDETNNTAADMDAGKINVEVGVALSNPAEFVVIRLGQTQSGSVATDSLEEA
jgi:phage tail sheath protein FI